MIVVTRYLLWLAALNLAWEIAQLPLYTIWNEASVAYIAFAVAHCTAGDMIIGAAALAIAVIVTRSGRPETWKWRVIAPLLALIGVGYTAYSEWHNTVLRPAWAYSELMPLLRVAGIEFGVSPLVQWLVLPPVALWIAQRSVARVVGRQESDKDHQKHDR